MKTTYDKNWWPKNEKQIFWNLFYEDFKIEEWLKENEHLKKTAPHKIGFKTCSVTAVLVCIFVKCYDELKFS